MLGWFGVPVGRVALVSMAAAGGATGLMMIGQAILKWDRPMWRRAPRRMSTIQMGRVVLLGSGIWFTVGATAFLWGGLFGELPKVVVLPILGTMGIGMAIFLVGLKLDRRRLYAAWAVEDAERRAGLIHH
jgi:hypothetical protein